MQTRRIGDAQVSAIGLGGMPMSIEGRPDEARRSPPIHAALDAGITLFDTADAYHLHAGRGRPQRVADRRAPSRATAATPRTCWSPPRAATCAPATARGRWTARREYLKEAGEASLKRLGVEAIGLYQFHRPDPTRPVRRLGRRDPRPAGRGQDPVWPASPTPTRRRSGRPTRSSAAGWSACRTSSRRRSAPASPSWSCATSWASPSCPGARSAASPAPRELGSRFAAFAEVARGARRQPAAGAALAWMLAKAPVVIPIPGASGRRRIRDSATAVDLSS